MLSGEATNANFIVFDLTRSGLESMIYQDEWVSGGCFPDSIHVLGQRWGLVGTIGRWLALATYYWPNIGPPYLHQQLLWYSRPNVGTTQLDQQLLWCCRPSIGLTQLNQLLSWTCWSNTIHANLCQQIFFLTLNII